MIKLLKILGQTIAISFEWLLMFIIFLTFAIHTSPVQTFITKKITNYLSKELKTEIKIDNVSIAFINKVVLKGVLIKDLENDTLAYISDLYITLDEINTKHKLIINEVEIENSQFNLIQRKKGGDFNYQFLIDYFSTDTTSTSSKPIVVELNKLHLTNVDFKYDDYDKKLGNFGMDYDHLDVKNIHLDMNQISINKGVISANIKRLSAEESCGFKLSKFVGKAVVSEKGIYAKKVFIKTPNSKIYAPQVHITMNDYYDYLTFIDSAGFDGNLSFSKVSLQDVAYFAPELEGMDQIVHVKGTVNEKTKNLKISNFILKTGDNTKLSGSISLPDFRAIHQAFFNEKLEYAFISIADLKKIKLPKSAGIKYMKFDESVERLKYFEAKNTRLDGFHSEFVFGATSIKTALGKIEVNNGILFTENKKNNSYFFEKSLASEYDVKIDNFNLGALIKNNDLGLIDGTVFLSGEAFSFTDIRFNDIEGKINHFDYLGYNYKNITVEKGKFINNVFDSKIKIEDDNLNLTYVGIIDLNKTPSYVIEVDIANSNLDALHLTKNNNATLRSNFKLNLKGNQLNNVSGTIELNDFSYSEGKKNINLPSANIDINRTKEVDFLSVQSKLGNVFIKGKVDFKTILLDLENQVSQLFPAIIPPKIYKKNLVKTRNQFNYKAEIKDINEFLALFVPDLKIAKGTLINGYYDAVNDEAELDITSNLIKFKELRFVNVNANQSIKNSNLIGKYNIKDFHLNDSIQVSDLTFDVHGTKESLNSELIWNPNSKDESIIKWDTKVLGIDKFNITLLPSFFNLKQKKWNIINASTIQINSSTIDVENFILERENQFLSIDGRISRNNEDQLNFKMNNFKLDDFGALINLPVEIKGLVNGWGYISNPYTNLTYIGDANIQDLYINKREIGNVFLQTEWDKLSNSFFMTGDLIFKNTKTFNFKGNYFPEKETNSLDFSLIFDNTDLLFVNAFMDPDLITNIKGSLLGELKVSGSFEDPTIQGAVQLKNGNAKLELMNTNYGLNGKIVCDHDGFYINNMPVTDEDGNTGSLVGSLYHTKFEDWNFDLNFNLEDNANRNGFTPGYNQLLDRFLVMNTHYKEDDIYYGKGYATGAVNIFGYTDNLEITVDLKTENGTKINFPMYGTSNIDEKETFINFKSAIENEIKEAKIDFTGVNLDLNIRVTPEAEVKIILNEDTGDEVKANGSGVFNISLNNFNDLTLDGTFTVNEGYYDFVMRPINQRFNFEKGGTVAWNGNPYNALLNLNCFYKVNASLQEISPNQNLGVNGSGKQEIKCIIELTESLLKPKINFDIQANTNEVGQSLLNRIKSPDLLNKQFFSLLLFNKFQRIDGQTSTTGTSAGSNAALDLVSSQLNTMLSQVSTDYKLNVALNKNNITGGNTMALGVTKGFYDDRLVLTGSFGVGSTGATTQQSSLISDFNLEYSLNKSGTFKINIFNESNQNTVLQNKIGLFTQGAGFQYSEDFNSLQDFQLFQYFIDLFRRKKNKHFKIKRNKRLTEIPPETVQQIFFNKQNWNSTTQLKTEYLFTTI